MTKIDIVIATLNSGKRIAKTLDSISRSTLPKDQWRIIVANNNSTDDTGEILSQWKDKLPLTVMDVPLAGKSNALNATIPLLRSPLIVFTDDDVDVDSQWLENLLKAADVNPDFDVFAGRIVGTWEQELDPELLSIIPVGSTYALHELDVSAACDAGVVWGPNMAIRKIVFDNGHIYNPAIGPQPKKLYPMGQDSEMAKRLARAGHKSYFVADAIVNHTIKKETANKDWIVKRAERLGYGIFAVKEGAVGYTRKLPDFILLVLELYLFFAKFIVLNSLKFLMRPKQKFWSEWGFYFHRGLIKGYHAFY